MKLSTDYWWNYNDRGKPIHVEKNLSQCQFDQHISYMK